MICGRLAEHFVGSGSGNVATLQYQATYTPFPDPKGPSLMDTFNGPSDAREDRPTGTARGRDEGAVIRGMRRRSSTTRPQFSGWIRRWQSHSPRLPACKRAPAESSAQRRAGRVPAHNEDRSTRSHSHRENTLHPSYVRPLASSTGKQNVAATFY